MMNSSYVPPHGGAAGGDPTGSPPDLLTDSTHHHTNVNLTGSAQSQAAAEASGPVVIGGASSQLDSKQEAEQYHYVNMEGGGYRKGEDGMDNDDDDDDDASLPSIVSSVMTADGIHDPVGFTIVCFVILIGDMSRGVMFPTLWPLVQELGGSTITLGYAVAAFSFGRIIVSPIFGSWSVNYGYSKVLMLSCSILFMGTLAYAQAQNVGVAAYLIFAQTLLGVGSGTLGVTRAFVAEVTATRTRTRYMAWITAVQYAGFTVTPFFGALFIKILGDRDYQFGLFRLNMYTAPAYFMGIICVITLGLLATYFQDRQRFKTQTDQKKSKRRTLIDDIANKTTMIGLTTYDTCILGCMLLNVATKGSIASFETMGISIASSDFDLTASRAATYVGMCGTVGVMALLSMGFFAMHFSDTQLISGGMVVMICGIMSLTLIGSDAEENATWRYLFAIFMVYSIGYPIAHTAVIGLFSKVVGRRPQGTLMGWFASAGSFARIAFPVMSGYVAAGNISNLFYILSIILSIATLTLLANRETLYLLST